MSASTLNAGSPLMIELFAGSARMAQTFREAGFETFTVDIEELSRDPERQIDLIADVLTLKAGELPPNPHVVWASPPCTYYTFARGANMVFKPGGKPDLPESLIANEIVEHTLHLIEELEPTYWFLENPHQGHLRQQPFMKKYLKSTVHYCNYGEDFQKPTDIWGRHPIHWKPKTHCHHRKHKVNIAGVFHAVDAGERALIPQPLCDEIVKAVVDSKGAYVVEDLRAWL